jgi:glutamyl-tRNA reductase
VPVIKALAEHAQAIQAGELALAKKRLAKGEDIETVLQSLAHGLSQKYLHGAYSQLHQLGNDSPESREAKADLIRELFGLKPDRHH